MSALRASIAREGRSIPFVPWAERAKTVFVAEKNETTESKCVSNIRVGKSLRLSARRAAGPIGGRL